MPCTADKKIVTSAGDGQLRLGEVSEDGRDVELIQNAWRCAEAVYMGLLWSLDIPTYFTAAVTMPSFTMYVKVFIH